MDGSSDPLPHLGYRSQGGENVAGYVLLDVEITDDAAFAKATERAPAVVKVYGGKYLVRGGDAQAVQGDWTPHRLVLVEFDNVEQAKAWWNSSDHATLRAMLDKCAKTSATIIEGV